MAGASAGTSISTVTGSNMITEVIRGAILGRIAGVVLRGAGGSTAESMIGINETITATAETFVMSVNITLIETIAMMISDFFTLLPIGNEIDEISFILQMQFSSW